jgi:nicotinamide-nucleotide amidase
MSKYNQRCSPRSSSAFQRKSQVEKIAQVLVSKNWTVSCAESCTGGGLAYAFTSIAGSSNWFNSSWVTYSNAAKTALLNVNADTLADYGAVSSQTVIQMALGAASMATADVAIATSGIAGPDGGSLEKPVGLVWFGLCTQGVTQSVSRYFEGDREHVREQAIDTALALLTQSLVE